MTTVGCVTFNRTLGVLGSGNLFLMNPNGIIFGSSASLDLRQNRQISFAQNRKDFRLFAAAVIISVTVILPYVMQSGQFGSTITDL